MRSAGANPLRRINTALDRSARTDVRVGRTLVPAYGLAVLTGVLSSVAVVLVLGVRRGLPLPTVMMVLAAGALVAAVLARAWKSIAGEERFTFFHYAIGVPAGAAIVLALLGTPVLPYLDLLAIALVICQAIGRAGCLMVGCCHGRPCRLGITYGRSHVDEGFPADLMGVRLFPIQAVEGLGAAIVAVLAILTPADAPAGAVLARTTAAYGAVRFILEPWRGDSERRHLWGLSEGQLTAAALVAIVAVAGRTFGFAAPAGVEVAAAAMLIASLAAVLRRCGVAGRTAGSPQDASPC